MPFAGFAARRICGALQAEAEGKAIPLPEPIAKALADARAAAIIGYGLAARWAPSTSNPDETAAALAAGADGLGRRVRGLPPVRTVPRSVAEAQEVMRKALAVLAGHPLPLVVAKSLSMASMGLTAMFSASQPMRFGKIPIQIEYPVGSVQTGTAPDGTTWHREFKNAYGHVLTGQDGGDGEALDVYLGPDESAPFAFWIQQTRSDGTFDEWKLILGATTRVEAAAIYDAHTPSRLRRAVTKMSMPVLRRMLGLDESGAAIMKARPVRDQLRSAGGPGAFDAFETATKVRPFTDAAGDHRFALGIVLAPQDPDNPKDLSGDVYTADEIEGAMQLWTEEYGNFDMQHAMIANDEIVLLDNFVLRCDEPGIHIGGKWIPRGSWLIGARFKSDDAWNAVKSGAKRGWSMNGLVRRICVECEQPMRRDTPHVCPPG